MVIAYFCLLVILCAACVGHGFAPLARIRFRYLWLLFAAVLDQVVVLGILPLSHPALLATAHLLSYVAAGAFLLLNRRRLGLWIIAVGGGLNGVVIAVNGGTLPASAAAVRASGRPDIHGHFQNSAVLPHPRLLPLGDVFATPAWLPGHNTFSIGDIVICCGVTVLVWQAYREAAVERRRAAAAPAADAGSPPLRVTAPTEP